MGGGDQLLYFNGSLFGCCLQQHFGILSSDPPADCKKDEECKDQERKFCEGGRCSQCRQTSGTFVEVLQVPTPKLFVHIRSRNEE